MITDRQSRLAKQRHQAALLTYNVQQYAARFDIFSVIVSWQIRYVYRFYKDA